MMAYTQALKMKISSSLKLIKSLEPILRPPHGGYQPTILAFWRGWCPGRYNWVNFDYQEQTCGVIQGRKLKNRRARTQASGWALARRTTVKCSSLDNFKSPPIPFSIF
jgi:hypothetical protein